MNYSHQPNGKVNPNSASFQYLLRVSCLSWNIYELPISASASRTIDLGQRVSPSYKMFPINYCNINWKLPYGGTSFLWPRVAGRHFEPHCNRNPMCSLMAPCAEKWQVLTSPSIHSSTPHDSLYSLPLPQQFLRLPDKRRDHSVPKDRHDLPNWIRTYYLYEHIVTGLPQSRRHKLMGNSRLSVFIPHPNQRWPRTRYKRFLIWAPINTN